MDRKKQAETAALIASNMANTSSAEILVALMTAYHAGYQNGFADGALAGSNHVAKAVDMIHRAMVRP